MLSLGGERGEQRLRAGIVVRIVERLHADLQQHLVVLAARARDPALDVDAVRHERERHRRGQLGERLGGAVRADAEPFDDDRDARLIGAARLRLHRARVDVGRARAVGADFRDGTMARGVGDARVEERVGVRLALQFTFFLSRFARWRRALLADGDFLPLAGRAVDDGDGLLLGFDGRRGRLGKGLAFVARLRLRRRRWRP